jgi:cytochrome c-type biogenesis protein CcmH
MNLWLVMGLMTAVAMAFVLLPLWRNRGSTGDNLQQRRDKNRDVFEQRQQELEGEVQSGQISEEDRQAMVVELQRAFLRDMEALETSTPKSVSMSLRLLPALLVLLVPVLSAWLYLDHGAWRDLAIPAVIADIQGAQSEEEQLAALNRLADTLKARFERKPEDVEAAYMLGTLLLEVERYDEAEATFEAMLDLLEPGPNRATVLGQLAQVRYVQADSTITEEVQATMDQALAMNPNESTVMDILAIDALLREDLVAALGYWRRELSQLAPGSQKSETMRQRIAVVESYMSQDEKAEVAATNVPVKLHVTISPELVDKVTPDMNLFVYIGNPGGGPPILARNIPSPEFPFDIVLDNSMSMLGAQLLPTQQVIAGARLSAGGATRQSGALEHESETFTPQALGDGTLSLTIDTVVP